MFVDFFIFGILEISFFSVCRLFCINFCSISCENAQNYTNIEPWHLYVLCLNVSFVTSISDLFPFHHVFFLSLHLLFILLCFLEQFESCTLNDILCILTFISKKQIILFYNHNIRSKDYCIL